MNPLYQQLMGQQTIPLTNNLQAAVMRAQQLMQVIQNPQQFVVQAFGNIPQEIRNDPNKILSYLQSNNMLNAQQLQALQTLRK